MINFGRITAITISLILVCLTVIADSAGKNEGVFKGTDYSFSFNVPETWIVDNKNGISQGLNTVLYPVQKSWTDSPVIIYGQSVSKSEIPTIKLQTEITILKHKNKGSHNYKIEKQSFLKISNQKAAELFHFSEDQWGNKEAIAYFKEENCINYLVYNARTKEMFKKHLNDFHSIVKTYKNLFR